MRGRMTKNMVRIRFIWDHVNHGQTVRTNLQKVSIKNIQYNVIDLEKYTHLKEQDTFLRFILFTFE